MFLDEKTIVEMLTLPALKKISNQIFHWKDYFTK